MLPSRKEDDAQSAKDFGRQLPPNKSRSSASGSVESFAGSFHGTWN